MSWDTEEVVRCQVMRGEKLFRDLTRVEDGVSKSRMKEHQTRVDSLFGPDYRFCMAKYSLKKHSQPLMDKSKFWLDYEDCRLLVVSGEMEVKKATERHPHLSSRGYRRHMEAIAMKVRVIFIMRRCM